MKNIKILLAVIVLVVIVIVVAKGVVFTKDSDAIAKSENPFVAKIEQEINAIQLKPHSSFCKEQYKEVAYLINTYHKEGRLGKDSSDVIGNDANKDFFESRLYSTYVDVFQNQAFYFFGGSSWNSDKLKFVRNEYRELLKSPFISDGVAKTRFLEIQSVFEKYDEIVGFVISCQRFAYSQTDLSSSFPISEVQSKIIRAKKYLDNNLENDYVRNCAHLRNQLQESPKDLFEANVNYLNNKIKYWRGKYKYYSSQRDYKLNFYDMLKGELEGLKNDIYKDVPKSGSEYDRLLSLLDDDSVEAYKYFKTN